MSMIQQHKLFLWLHFSKSIYFDDDLGRDPLSIWHRRASSAVAGDAIDWRQPATGS